MYTHNKTFLDSGQYSKAAFHCLPALQFHPPPPLSLLAVIPSIIEKSNINAIAGILVKLF